jgi:hypothetical protein
MLSPSEAKGLAIAARAIDVPWIASFLNWADSPSDARRVLNILRSNSPDKFHNDNPKRPTGRDAKRQRRRK